MEASDDAKPAADRVTGVADCIQKSSECDSVTDLRVCTLLSISYSAPGPRESAPYF